jgi:hypothetical protein
MKQDIEIKQIMQMPHYKDNHNKAKRNVHRMLKKWKRIKRCVTCGKKFITMRDEETECSCRYEKEENE